MTENEVAMAEDEMDFSDDLMTPEELRVLKELQEKAKRQKKSLAKVKENFFDEMSELFASTIIQAKKDVVTVSTTKNDEGYFSFTFGKDTENEVDTESIADTILEQFEDKILPLMGIGNSVRISGEIEGEKYFWQVRRIQK